MTSRMKFIRPEVLYAVEVEVHEYDSRVVGKVIDVAGERYLYRHYAFHTSYFSKTATFSIDRDAIHALRDKVQEIHLQFYRDASTPEMSVYSISMEDFIANARGGEHGEGHQLYVARSLWNYERRQYIIPGWTKEVRKVKKGKGLEVGATA